MSVVSNRLLDRELLRASAISGRVALPSEMVCCEANRIEVLPDETGVCSITKQRVLLSELGECTVSRRVMLKSLLKSSDFSGKVVDRELLQRSEKPPHREGFAAEFGRCVISGRRLLKDELGESAVSSRIVDLDLLVRSEASQSLALPEEMASCARTHKRVLPIELVECSITQQRVVRAQMEQSDLSGRWALREHALRLPDSRIALTVETVGCVWLGAPIARSEAGRCGLTGQIVSMKFLNGDGQLAPLADLLDGVARGVGNNRTLFPSLRQLDPDLAGLTNFLQVCSPGGNQAVLCEVHSKGWFKTKVRYYGLLIRVTGTDIEAVGCGVRGYRDAGNNFVIDQEDLVFG